VPVLCHQNSYQNPFQYIVTQPFFPLSLKSFPVQNSPVTFSFGAVYFSHKNVAVKQNVIKSARFEIGRVDFGGSAVPVYYTVQLFKSKGFFFPATSRYIILSAPAVNISVDQNPTGPKTVFGDMVLRNIAVRCIAFYTVTPQKVTMLDQEDI
jgi:hypothetical protein